MPGFLEGIVSILAKAIMDKISGEIKAAVANAMFRNGAYEAADRKKTELAEEMANAKTQEERDAILDKIYEARPKFS